MLYFYPSFVDSSEDIQLSQVMFQKLLIKMLGLLGPDQDTKVD